MAKKRKTLEQKKQAELRHLATQPEQTISTSPVYSLGDFSTPSVTKLSPNSTQQQIRSSNSTASIAYAYAFSDLRKTFFTTLAIVVAQIVLFFIVNK